MTLSIEARLTALESAVAALKPIDVGDLNSEWANFVVRKSPPAWLKSGGIDYEGRRLSETTPEFCEAVASLLDWRAGKEEGETKTYIKKATGESLPVAPLTRKDAARARAWAAKLRATVHAVASHDEAELPF